MSTDPQSPETPMDRNDSKDSMPCPNCRSAMPLGMRFCRICGFRLGEGVAEFTETVRLGSAPSRGSPHTMSAGSAGSMGPGQWGAMGAPAHVGIEKKKRKSKGPHWIVWVILGIIIASVAGGSFIRPFNISIGGKSGGVAKTSKAKFGVNEFNTVEGGGGAMLDAITPPDGPADKAGLLGGDIITIFDNRGIPDEDEMRKILQGTPVGKTVDVTYIRDGETKTTKLTTTSEEELDRLTEAFENRPGGRGFIGEGTNLDRVQVQIDGKNTYGVLLNDVRKNRPGYVSGLRTGDIVVEFGGIPMRTRREFELRIERATPDSVVKTVVMRDGQKVELDIKIGFND
jgi:membrane-associated protease RseP (regulator of RpoE activity)